MIKHCVLLKFRPDTTPAQQEVALDGLRSLVGQVPGLLDFCGGPNCSPEGEERGYTHAFLMTFDTMDSLRSYLKYPAHAEAAARVLACLEGGVDGVLALDFEV